tara:strand:+ start:1533 stop:1808 length:276 start_codon:yes stop_codon:yes gene_type:complete
VSTTVLPDVHGRRSPLYEELAKNLFVESYTATIMLSQVNGKKLTYNNFQKVMVENDTRDSFRIKPVEKVRVNKTNGRESIFIKVLNIFKRQ